MYSCAWLYYHVQTSLYLTCTFSVVVLFCTVCIQRTCHCCYIILHRPACTWPYLQLRLYYPVQISLYLNLPAAIVLLSCTDQPALELTSTFVRSLSVLDITFTCCITLHRPSRTWPYIQLWWSYVLSCTDRLSSTYLPLWLYCLARTSPQEGKRKNLK